MKKYELNILELYPKDMNIYGDSGNVLVLKKRAEKRNISVNILSYNIGDSFPKNVDIVVAGGGQDKIGRAHV